MTIKNGQTITASDVTERVNQFIESVGYDKVLEDAADYEKYNSVTGTTLGEEGYNTLISEAPEYLYTLIPEGAATYSSEAEGEDKPTVERYTAEEAAAYNEGLDGAIHAGDDKETELTDYDYIHDEASWNASYANGELKKYYANADAASPYRKDLWAVADNQAVTGAFGWGCLVKDENENPVEFEDGYHYVDSEGNACIRCWQGAIGADGAKYPWIMVHDLDLDGELTFKYEGKDDVTSWTSSVAKAFNDETFAIEENGGEGAFDISKFSMILTTKYTQEEANEYNATLPGAVKEGDEKPGSEVTPETGN